MNENSLRIFKNFLFYFESLPKFNVLFLSFKKKLMWCDVMWCAKKKPRKWLQYTQSIRIHTNLLQFCTCDKKKIFITWYPWLNGCIYVCLFVYINHIASQHHHHDEYDDDHVFDGHIVSPENEKLIGNVDLLLFFIIT